MLYPPRIVWPDANKHEASNRVRQRLNVVTYQLGVIRGKKFSVSLDKTIVFSRLVLFVALISGLAAQTRLQLKNGPSQLSALFSSQPAHVLIATSPDTPAGFADLLAQRGARIVRTLPLDHYLISAPAGIDFSDLQFSSALQLDASLKVSAALNADGFYVVEFHPDISAGDAASLLVSDGFLVHSRPDMAPSHLLVEGTLAGAWKLAQDDAVAYIFGASDDLIQGNPVRPCASAVTTAGGIGQYIATYGDGWDGPGNGFCRFDLFFPGTDHEDSAGASHRPVPACF